jgi:hypothetical protein
MYCCEIKPNQIAFPKSPITKDLDENISKNFGENFGEKCIDCFHNIGPCDGRVKSTMVLKLACRRCPGGRKKGSRKTVLKSKSSRKTVHKAKVLEKIVL